ncbi:MAG: hypothetical protein KF814_05450 [Nitrospiraceae bacterium]|nr:hypothetical protein [Nitrospiraceae bacterium]
MMRFGAWFTLGAIMFWAAAAAGETLPLTAGYYEVQVSGLPGGSTEARDRCLTPEHLGDPEGVFTYAFAKKYTPLPGHKVLNFSAQSGKIRYDVDTPASNIHVEGTASATEFSVLRSAKSKSGKGVAMSMKLDGKRTGDCDKGH